MKVRHPTPDQRRAEAVEQATSAFDRDPWPGLDIDAAHITESSFDYNEGMRHFQLVKSLEWHSDLLRRTLVKIFIANWALALLTLLAYLIFAPAAHAQHINLLVHQLSYHTDRSQDFNEVNPGLAMQYRSQARLSSLGDERSDVFASPLSERVFANGYVQAGFYKNSYRRQTIYAALGSEPFALGPVRVGAVIAAGTGYGTRTVTEQRTGPPSLQLCRGKTCAPPEPTTFTITRTEPTSALRAVAGLSASLQSKRFGLQLVAMPPLRVNGNTLSSGVFAASLMVRI